MVTSPNASLCDNSALPCMPTITSRNLCRYIALLDRTLIFSTRHNLRLCCRHKRRTYRQSGAYGTEDKTRVNTATTFANTTDAIMPSFSGTPTGLLTAWHSSMDGIHQATSRFALSRLSLPLRRIKHLSLPPRVVLSACAPPAYQTTGVGAAFYES